MNETPVQPKGVQKNDSQDEFLKGGIPDSSVNITKPAGFFGGLFLFLLMVLSSPPEGLSPEGWRTAAVATLMATWWVTEVIPIAGTALLPIILFPLLGVLDVSVSAAPYANPMIYLFLGGF